MTWNLAPLIAAAALLVVNPAAVVRVRARWRTRNGTRRDWCETCGARPRRIYELGTRFDDDDALGIGDDETGGSFMAATYCREHAPAGATRKPNPYR